MGIGSKVPFQAQRATRNQKALQGKELHHKGNQSNTWEREEHYSGPKT